MEPQGRQILSGIAKRVRENGLTGKIDQIEVVGHTSSEGDDARNWTLSAQRAVTVALYLIQHDSLSPCQVSALGRGRYYPVNPQLAQVERSIRPEDRRIELEITPLVKDSTQALRRAGCVPEPGKAQ
jgi:outer membrane protein OmpA-like peptidoglycan-associated protein